MTIERAAKAIAANMALHEQAWKFWQKEARAALDAIAEPTPEMIEAGWARNNVSRDEIIIIWHAMHAAMMKDTK